MSLNFKILSAIGYLDRLAEQEPVMLVTEFENMENSSNKQNVSPITLLKPISFPTEGQKQT